MRARKKRGRAPLAAMDQINVTPLLDLTFLLLIAFMITMPLMEYGTTINPPEMDADKLPELDFKSITITKQGTIMLERDTITREQLPGRLAALKADNPKVQLLLRSDGERSYAEVMELMALIRRSGFGDVTLVTQAEKAPK